MNSKPKTLATKEEANPARVPKLRFPEFRAEKPWEPTTIGALGNFYYGKSAPKWSLSEDAPTPCVRYGELYTKFGPVITETYSRTNTDPETLRFSKGGEILIPRVGEKPEDFGKCCCYLPLKDIAIGEMISVLETKQHPLFYTYYFRHLHKQFAKVVEGQNVKNLYYVELEPLAIHRPSIPEQQKIAECLSSADELMAAQARKVDSLKTHKKGLMQQLFPREGETAPRLRFPEFRDAGEWEAQSLGELSESISSGKDKAATDGAFDLYGSTGIIGKTHNRSYSGNYLLVARVGANAGLLTKATGEFGVTDNTLVIILKEQRSTDFILYYLDQVGLNKMIFGSGQPLITGGQLKALSLQVPKPAEQQRIASCLSSLDALVAAETRKLEALKTHKKGLMQQLFLSLDEVEA